MIEGEIHATEIDRFLDPFSAELERIEIMLRDDSNPCHRHVRMGISSTERESQNSNRREPLNVSHAPAMKLNVHMECFENEGSRTNRLTQSLLNGESQLIDWIVPGAHVKENPSIHANNVENASHLEGNCIDTPIIKKGRHSSVELISMEGYQFHVPSQYVDRCLLLRHDNSDSCARRRYKLHCVSRRSLRCMLKLLNSMDQDRSNQPASNWPLSNGSLISVLGVAETLQIPLLYLKCLAMLQIRLPRIWGVDHNTIGIRYSFLSNLNRDDVSSIQADIHISPDAWWRQHLLDYLEIIRATTDNQQHDEDPCHHSS